MACLLLSAEKIQHAFTRLPIFCSRVVLKSQGHDVVHTSRSQFCTFRMLLPQTCSPCHILYDFWKECSCPSLLLTPSVRTLLKFSATCSLSREACFLPCCCLLLRNSQDGWSLPLTAPRLPCQQLLARNAVTCGRLGGKNIGGKRDSLAASSSRQYLGQRPECLLQETSCHTFTPQYIPGQMAQGHHHHDGRSRLQNPAQVSPSLLFHPLPYFLSCMCLSQTPWIKFLSN